MDNKIYNGTYLPACVPETVIPKKKKSSGWLSTAFRNDKRVYLSFLIAYAFFAGIGFFYSLYFPSTAAFCVALLRTFVPGFMLEYGSLRLVIICAVLSVSGMTVFGCISSSLYLACASIICGVLTAYFINIAEFWLVAVGIALTALFAFVSLLLCSNVFVYSRRALKGRNELFQPKPLIRYILICIISLILKITIVYTLLLTTG